MVARKKVQVDEGGPEPKWESKLPCKTIDITIALNWYGTYRTENDAAKYLDVPVTIAKGFLSTAWLHRMVSKQGYVLDKQYSVGYKTRMNSVKNAKKLSTTIKKQTPVVSIQDRVIAKTNEYIGEMEGLVDDFGIHGKVKDMNAYQWMLDNEVKAVHANKIAQHFREEAMEVYNALKGTDKELKEAYEGVGERRMMNMLKCFAAIIKDAETLAQNASKTRKPRKRKPVSFEKRVSKLNYMNKYDALKIQSVDPVGIVGAASVWVYNVKTRKLGFYVSTDSSGLSVKGSTLENFSANGSFSKTLRKPERVLPDVIGGGKIALRNVMDNIAAKPAKLTGRINKDTVILRIS